MSPLTKILVILVVVLTLIQTAATVVFVNRVSITEDKFVAEQDIRKAAETKMNDLQSQLEKTTATITDAKKQAQDQVGAQQQEVIRLQQQLADSNVKAAEANSRLGLVSVDNTRLTEALKASEDTKSKLADTVTDTRKINDGLSKENSALNASNADLTNKLSVTERDRRFLSEQIAEMNSRGTTAPSSAAPGSAAMPAAASSSPSINAQVKAVRTLSNNLPYATLSVGTADRVTTGMKFTVLDGSGAFLGFVTIESAEANESFGKLSGPRVADIKAGDQASTQLQ